MSAGPPLSQSGHDGQGSGLYKDGIATRPQPLRSLSMSRYSSRSSKRRARTPWWAAVLSGCAAALKALPRLLRLLGPGAAFPRPDLSRVDRLVFVCEGNLYRSAFAQALCEQNGLRAASFGLHTQTGRRSPSPAVQAAAALGVRLESHHATHMRDFQMAAGDLYLVMDASHVERLQRRGFPAGRTVPLGLWCRPLRLRIRDPHRKGEKHIRRCFSTVQSAVTHLSQELRRARMGMAPAGDGAPVGRHEADAVEEGDAAAA